MPKFIFTCPHCTQKMEAESEWIGQQAECPCCNKDITITEQKKVIKPVKIFDSQSVSPEKDSSATPDGKNSSVRLQPDEKYCPYCNEVIKQGAVFCRYCKSNLSASGMSGQMGNMQGNYYQNPVMSRPPKSKTAYILLGVFFGALGIHDFYAGFQYRGLIKLLASLASIFFFGITGFIMWVWAIVDICTTEVDANGIPFSQ